MLPMIFKSLGEKNTNDKKCKWLKATIDASSNQKKEKVGKSSSPQIKTMTIVSMWSYP